MSDTMELYVSDDGHVRFVVEADPSTYLDEPLLVGSRLTLDPETTGLIVEWRRYKLSRIRFGSVKECNTAKAWVGDSAERLKHLWEIANG